MDIFLLQLWEILQDLGWRHTVCEPAEHVVDGDAQASDHRAATPFSGLYPNSV
jgi:hypothetical protein